MNKIMSCWSVRLDAENKMDGLILSNSDLQEAHFRYVKYFNDLTAAEKTLRLGQIKQRSFVTKRPGARPVELLLVYFTQECGKCCGYLFAMNDMVRIIERTKKLEATIKRPTRFQKFLIWINVLIGNLIKE